MTQGTAIDIDGPARCNCAQLRRAARSVTRFYNQCLAPSGISANQFTILGNLVKHGSMRITVLGDLLAMDRATIGHNLRPLERDGFVAITPDPSDRRARQVGIAIAGLAKFTEAKSLWDAAQLGFESSFGQAEAATLRRTLDRVVDQRLTT